MARWPIPLQDRAWKSCQIPVNAVQMLQLCLRTVMLSTCLSPALMLLQQTANLYSTLMYKKDLHVTAVAYRQTLYHSFKKYMLSSLHVELKNEK